MGFSVWLLGLKPNRKAVEKGDMEGAKRRHRKLNGFRTPEDESGVIVFEAPLDLKN